MKLKEFYQNKEENSYEKDIFCLVKNTNPNPILFTAILIVLAGIGLVYIACIYNHYNCDTCTYFYVSASAVLFIVSIVCFFIYKSIITSKTNFLKENLLFRDLTIAMNIAENLPDTDLNEETETRKEDQKTTGEINIVTTKISNKKVSPKTRAKEHIIQTLLNRYSN